MRLNVMEFLRKNEQQIGNLEDHDLRIALTKLGQDIATSFGWGISKFAFTETDEPEYVYKIPYTSNRDYCHDEVVVYGFAEKAGVSELFAKSEYVGTVGKVKVYRQQKVEKTANEAYCEFHRHFSQVEKKVVYEMEWTHRSIECEPWLFDVVDYYGEELAQKFLTLLKEKDINDLHQHNVGYIGLRPVVFDYSGYCNRRM